MNVDLAAWSVHSTANATVTVTIRDPDMRDPDRLRRVLAQAGVPASVQVVHPKGSYTIYATGCEGIGQDGLRHVIDVLHPRGSPENNGTGMFTIKLSAMPPGSVLSFVFFAYDRLARAHHKYGLVAFSLHYGTPPPCVVPTTVPK